jgi:hypothetical protein
LLTLVSISSKASMNIGKIYIFLIILVLQKFVKFDERYPVGLKDNANLYFLVALVTTLI